MPVRLLSGPFFVTNVTNTETYSLASQTSTMELFVKLVNSQQLTTFAKSSMLNVFVSFECAFVVVSDEHQYQFGMDGFQ